MKLGRLLLYKALITGSFVAGYYVNNTDKADVSTYLRDNPQDRKEIFMESRNYMTSQTLNDLRQSELTKEDIYNFTQQEVDNIWDDTKRTGRDLGKKVEEESSDFLDKVKNAWNELKK